MLVGFFSDLLLALKQRTERGVAQLFELRVRLAADADAAPRCVKSIFLHSQLSGHTRQWKKKKEEKTLSALETAKRFYLHRSLKQRSQV